MKKLIACLLILSITTTSLVFNINRSYGEIIRIEPNDISSSKEDNYIKQLDNISNQLVILSANILSKITNNQDKSPLLKDGVYIKSQIRQLRLELSDYHKTESGNIEKNPISLALLNTLNFYSMSLSYLFSVLEYDDASDESKYLQLYYTNKSSGDNMLLWLKYELSK